MRRYVTVLAALGFILVALASVSAAAYGVGAAAESFGQAHGMPGLGRITNILFLMLIFVMIIATVLTIAERKWSAMMQDRIGPNRARIQLPGLKNRALGGLAHVAAGFTPFRWFGGASASHANDASSGT